MAREHTVNLVRSPRNENFHRLVRDGKIVGSITIVDQNAVQLENAEGEVLGVYENADMAVTQIEEMIDLGDFNLDPLQ